jgi:TRAP-type C4-dicarboxylate transport system permease small subunit
MVLALGTTLNVLLRYLLARPIHGFVELSSLVGAVLLAACMPHLLVTRGNIAVDALGSRLGRRAHRALDRFAALLTTGFFLVMAWQYVRFATELRQTAETIPVLRWPVWPWWTMVAAAILLAGLAGALTLNRAADPATDPAEAV